MKNEGYKLIIDKECGGKFIEEQGDGWFRLKSDVKNKCLMDYQ